MDLFPAGCPLTGYSGPYACALACPVPLQTLPGGAAFSSGALVAAYPVHGYREAAEEPSYLRRFRVEYEE